ncbi:MAG: hpcH/HpaI aldolase/citrate lyase family protein [Devosia sp.]|nr:hpcH/HpaI aldolase/citrate lyase family protein [Devosia sp.]
MPIISNAIRTRWAEGKPVTNGWLSIGNIFTAEIVAGQGYDAVTVDMQHGMMGFDVALQMLVAIRAAGPVPLVRVPRLEPGIIGKVLDAGALGVICPMINTVEEVRQLVSYTKYPPLGERSSGPARAALLYEAPYDKFANREILVFAMIETQAAFDALADIAAVPGLDGLYIGPSDLTLALTNGRLAPGFDREEPEVVAAIRTIIDTAHAAGIKCALHTGSSAYAAKGVAWGADLVTLLNDSRMLAAAAAESVKSFHTALAGSRA